MSKEVAEYIEAQLEFDPKDIGASVNSEFEIRVFKTKSKNKNICLNVIITSKENSNAPQKRLQPKNNFPKH